MTVKPHLLYRVSDVNGSGEGLKLSRSYLFYLSLPALGEWNFRTVLMKGKILLCLLENNFENSNLSLQGKREFLLTTNSLMSGTDFQVFSTFCPLCFYSSCWLCKKGKKKSVFCSLFSHVSLFIQFFT